MTENHKINIFLKIISVFLFIQSFVLIYEIAKNLNQFVTNELYSVLFVFVSVLLLFAASIGIALQKCWPIIVHWIFAILPAFLYFTEIRLNYYVYKIYIFIILSTILLTFFVFLFTSRKNKIIISTLLIVFIITSGVIL